MLKICYLSDNPIRIENAQRILERMESNNVIDRSDNRFRTKDAEYVFIDCRNCNNYIGIYADQAIIDYRDPMRGIAQAITAMSCVPDQYRIIDDREIAASDFKGIWHGSRHRQ